MIIIKFGFFLFFLCKKIFIVDFFRVVLNVNKLYEDVLWIVLN